VALALAMIPEAANAHYLSHADPRDTEGGFDMQSVRLRTVDRELFGKVVDFGDAFEPYPDGAHGWDLTVRFDSRGDDRMDFFVQISYHLDFQGIHQASLYRRGGRHVADIGARTMSESQFRFRFGRRLLKSTKHVRWSVSVTSDDLDGNGYEDHAPDSGWFNH
jgi:hypothetical protein